MVKKRFKKGKKSRIPFSVFPDKTKRPWIHTGPTKEVRASPKRILVKRIGKRVRRPTGIQVKGFLGVKGIELKKPLESAPLVGGVFTRKGFRELVIFGKRTGDFISEEITTLPRDTFESTKRLEESRANLITDWIKTVVGEREKHKKKKRR